MTLLKELYFSKDIRGSGQGGPPSRRHYFMEIAGQYFGEILERFIWEIRGPGGTYFTTSVVADLTWRSRHNALKIINPSNTLPRNDTGEEYI